jgi:hypothetical protein
VTARADEYSPGIDGSADVVVDEDTPDFLGYHKKDKAMRRISSSTIETIPAK